MDVPPSYWSEAVLTATYLINCMPSRVLNNKSLVSVLTSQHSFMLPPKIFGCVYFVKNHQAHSKLEPKSKPTPDLK